MPGILPCLLSLVLLTQPAVAPGAAPPLAIPEYAHAFHRGDYARATALAAERLKVRPADVQARILLARAEAAMGRFEAAYTGFRKALDTDPRSADALYYLGITGPTRPRDGHGRQKWRSPGSRS